MTLAAIDSVPAPWTPLRFRHGRLQGRHGAGAIDAAQIDWLRTALPVGKPALLVLHHYPLAVAPIRWNARFEVPMEIPAADRAKLWAAAQAAGVRLILCGHVHRARLEWHEGIAIGLQGQSGAAWAGRSIGWYQVGDGAVTMEVERTA